MKPYTSLIVVYNLLCTISCHLILHSLDESSFCQDGVDNDDNGFTDCEDEVCIETDACVLPAFCGDGALSAGEGCDDGNTTNGDGCDSSCQLEFDAFVDCSAINNGDGSLNAPFSSIQNAVNSMQTGELKRFSILDNASICRGPILIDSAKQVVLVGSRFSTIDVESFGFRITGNATVIIKGLSLTSDGLNETVLIDGTARAAFLSVDVQNRNTGSRAVGLRVFENDALLLVDSSTIRNNPGGGIAIEEGAEAVIVNSLLQNNGQLGISAFAAIQNENESQTVGFFLTFDGNIIGNNGSTLDASVMDCRGDNPFRIENSIVHNTNQARLFSEDPECIVNHTNIFALNPEITGLNNINEDPLFIDPAQDNFHLSNTSPCIDQGNPSITTADFPFDPDAIFGPLLGNLAVLEHDAAGTPRIKGTLPDLGMFEDF